jgi:uridine kinase
MDIKVKDIIQYLTENFDPDSLVYLEHDGWLEDDSEDDAQEIIYNRGIFTKFDNDLFIEN